MSEPEVALSAAVPRTRIHPTFLETLRTGLGRRDWVKGERASINEILTHVRGQAEAAGFQSMPVGPDDKATDRALKHAKLDGIARMLDEKPELFQPGELTIMSKLLFEAAVHGLRPHAGHDRATPSHVAQMARARNDAPPPPLDVPQPLTTSADAHARIDELASKVDGLDAKLDQLLAAVTAPK